MKLTTLWDQYQHYTRDLTEHTRKLGFAAGAICWLFRNPEGPIFPGLIQGALLFLVAFFVSDILHCFLGSLALKKYLEDKEAEIVSRGETLTEDTVILHTRDADRAAFSLYRCKVAFLLLSFGMIGSEIVRRILV